MPGESENRKEWFRYSNGRFSRFPGVGGEERHLYGKTPSLHFQNGASAKVGLAQARVREPKAHQATGAVAPVPARSRFPSHAKTPPAESSR